jgi:hypothetical protein
MANFYAYTIIGLKISKSDLKNENNEYILNYTKIDNVDGELKINDAIYKVTKIHADDDFHYILLYEGCSGTKSKCPFSLELLCKMKEELKINLQSINLWADDKFGIYTDEVHSH